MQFLRAASSAHLKSVKLFATTSGNDGEAYALVAYVSNMQVFDKMRPVLSSMSFRQNNGQWVTSGASDQPMRDEFVKACRKPFTFWKSEQASEEVLK